MKAPTKRASSRNGSALLIILAFVLLLTILTTAFLSKALLEKTVSNASADQTRTDVFAAGAVDAILADCQQEIAAGSSISTQTIGSTKVTTYSPAIPAGKSSALTIIPSRMAAGSSKTAIGFSNSSTLANLLKTSSCAVPFYPNSDTTDFPNASSYPPCEATFSSADPKDSTSVASLNGRSYSPARWNQALLLPKKTYSSSTDFTPNAYFTVPDWILVQRDGTNPTSWTSSLCIASATDVTTANKNPVVGRYAYAIYDEGGLLDMNVAGYPSTAAPSTASTHFYRSSLATVDLTQLLDPNNANTAFYPNVDGTKNPGNPVIDALVGWRNNATLQASGTVPSYTFTAAVATNYFYNVSPPGTGFMHTTVPSSVTSLATGQSDRKFSSRQQLIGLLLNQIAPSLSANTTLANAQNSLQYMGTFSRDLSQPSYQPDAGRPRMSVSATTVTTTASTTVTDYAFSGGNAAASDDSNNYINVGFPTTLVQQAFTRNDGSAANVGDPLVKKRFALNRLAWLTFDGPIADDTGKLNPGNIPGIATLITLLENNYGYTASFLSQGGPTNIKNYFGLQWQQDPNDDNGTKRYKWFYNVHNKNGIIRELGGANGIAASGDASAHDPDFFELLKAAILAGSKGKTMTDLSGSQYYQSNIAAGVDMNHPYNAQNNADVSLDYQILQIGANIIDQSRLDAYTTEIIFDNGTGPYEVRGVENYPYLYRLRSGALKLRNEHGIVADDVDKTTVPDNQVKYPNTAAGFNDTGLGALMQIPEIWNPHDYNSPLGGITSAAFPTQFRIVVDSTTPGNLATQGTLTPTYSSINAYGFDGPANTPVNNPYSSSASATAIGFYLGPPSNTVGSVSGGYSGENLQLKPSNTALTFTVPASASTLWREPTMLVRPNLPAGSNLQVAWTSAPTDWTTARNTANKVCYSAGNGFLSDLANPLALPSPSAAEASAPTTQTYLGIVLGLYPIQWIISNGTPSTSNNYIYFSNAATFNSSLANYGLTYRMQYTDPIQGGWVTYDEKYISPNANWVMTTVSGGTGNLVQKGGSSYFIYQSAAWQTFADPRTSRFGAIGGDNDTWTYDAAPGTYPYKSTTNPDWLDAANGVLVTDRPDYSQGFLFETYRAPVAKLGGTKLNNAFTPGWVSANTSASTSPTYSTFRWGPVSQNTVSSTAQANMRYSGDTATSPGAYQAFYYADGDGVVRRAMGGEVPNSSTAPTYLFGYPMTTATVGYKYPSGGSVQATQSASRPYLLKRPFTSVAELGYVFSGTPWKNLDFSNPESGDSSLLDVFCINDTDDPNGLVAGKVNLNTQQVPVLAAILSEAYYDDVLPNKASGSSGSFIGSKDPIGAASGYTTAATTLASYLVNGPAGTTGTAKTPLMNMRELVGKWVAGSSTSSPVDGTASFTGYSSDIGTFYNPTSGAGASYYNAYQTRCREAAVRALSAVGQTRVWNLMIDVVAQTGRYPATAADASNFIVEGERRYWVHVAIDRYTGNILDRQIEEVRQ